jgi:hypothetical protein
MICAFLVGLAVIDRKQRANNIGPRKKDTGPYSPDQNGFLINRANELIANKIKAKEKNNEPANEKNNKTANEKNNETANEPANENTNKNNLNSIF